MFTVLSHPVSGCYRSKGDPLHTVPLKCKYKSNEGLEKKTLLIHKAKRQPHSWSHLDKQISYVSYFQETEF